MNYTAPVDDMLFCMKELAGLEALTQLPGWEDAGLETAQAVLQECAKFNETVVAPLNTPGDKQPATWRHGEVTTTPGFKEAFHQFGQGGWQGLQHDTEYGGQGLPKTIGAACIEMLNSASLSFALCPLLTDGAIEALLTAGSAEQKALYLPKMISGEWTGTMNLTEPQAGSDLAAVRTRAEPQADGSFHIFGTKIYITYGEHDMAANIIHLVLARLPGAPDGVKGLSLFIVPKFKVHADGSLGERNDVTCVSLEHKLGIKASPTAVLQFGNQGGAQGHLMGLPHRGLSYMFVMMNAARYAVGVQGIAVAERAYQKAVQFARERIQSRAVDQPAAHSVAIIHHPDVKRMLMTMRATTQAGRAMAMAAAGACDLAHHHPDPAVRQAQLTFYEYLVPLVKGFCTEASVNVTSLGIQVHGGMGFIEETGAAQLWRDARILTIYEGTTAIQANDLLGRKTLRDGGAMARSVMTQIQATEGELAQSTSAQAASVAQHLKTARQALEEVITFMVTSPSVASQYAGAMGYLMLSGTVVAGWQMARALRAAQEQLMRSEGHSSFLEAKIATAVFYAEHLLSQAPSMAQAVIQGSGSTLSLAPESF